ncbi:unnamed protein product [Amoebophrya sp. A25]|nr:unnamed protein product [Amoebophrya sp. A25]|eukprot:GSA25T00012669001.1
MLILCASLGSLKPRVRSSSSPATLFSFKRHRLAAHNQPECLPFLPMRLQLLPILVPTYQCQLMAGSTQLVPAKFSMVILFLLAVFVLQTYDVDLLVEIHNCSFRPSFMY